MLSTINKFFGCYQLSIRVLRNIGVDTEIKSWLKLETLLRWKLITFLSLFWEERTLLWGPVKVVQEKLVTGCFSNKWKTTCEVITTHPFSSHFRCSYSKFEGQKKLIDNRDQTTFYQQMYSSTSYTLRHFQEKKRTGKKTKMTCQWHQVFHRFPWWGCHHVSMGDMVLQ